MRRIITLAALSISLLGSGAAMAQGRYEGRNEHRDRTSRYEARREIGRERARDWRHDRSMRPEPRIEHHMIRPGHRWVPGEWRWNGYEWVWRPGHEVRTFRR
jgi:hypothetical protein